MKKAFVCCFALLTAWSFAVSPGSCFGQLPADDRLELPASIQPYRSAAIERWTDSIRAFDKQNQAVQSDPDSVLLLGSSSIRLWETAAQDLKPFTVIRRGYGGAKFTDLAVFAEQLVKPHQFRAVVIFVANDVSGREDDHSIALIEDCVRHVLSVIRNHQPAAEVLFVEITPTESRWKVWPEIRKVNAMLRELALTEPRTGFITTAEHFLSPSDQPLSQLFRNDRLHLNADGYRVWSDLIHRQLDRVLHSRSESGTQP